MLRIASVAKQVSRLQRVSSVGVTDGASLVVLCARRGWFVVVGGLLGYPACSSRVVPVAV